VFLHIFGGLGITAGAHRLWSHRSYKAALPVRILLMIMNSSALQDLVVVTKNVQKTQLWAMGGRFKEQLVQ
ncbi:hypothetical protein NECAME_18547, partial [Necator americanus]